MTWKGIVEPEEDTRCVGEAGGVRLEGEVGGVGNLTLPAAWMLADTRAARLAPVGEDGASGGLAVGD